MKENDDSYLICILLSSISILHCYLYEFTEFLVPVFNCGLKRIELFYTAILDRLFMSQYKCWHTNKVKYRMYSIINK